MKTTRLAPLAWVPFLLALVAVAVMSQSGCRPGGAPAGGARDPAGAAAGAGQDADAFYDPDVVQDVAVTIDPADIDAMNAALPARVYVPATLSWNGVVVDDVGVRYKGDSSSIPGVDMQRSMLIHTNEYVDGQTFLGLKHIAFDNGCQLGAVFSQRIITDLLAERGVLTPRANFVRVTVNGAYQGVFVNEERIDNVFLDAHFGGHDGSLYKVDYAGPGSDFALIDDDPATYAGTFDKKNHESRDDTGEIVDFLRLVNDGDLESGFDVHGFIKLMGVMVLSGAFDQLTGFNAHNYYLHHGKDGVWTYLPHDLDVGFADHAFGQIEVIDGWDAGAPLPEPPRPLLSRILDDEALDAEYLQEARTTLDVADFDPRLDALYAQVKDDLAREPWPAARLTNPEDSSWDGIVQSMHDFVSRRGAAATEELGAP